VTPETIGHQKKPGFGSQSIVVLIGRTAAADV
jgi:hypothetical protein